jgi:hypothetical protein
MFKITSLLLTALIFVSSLAAAEVAGFKGLSGETLLIESTSDPKVNFIRVTGVSSEWADKVIKTRREKDSAKGTEYVIDYEKKHGISKGLKHYYFVTVSGVAAVHLPGAPKEGLEFKSDKVLTEASQSAGLAAIYTKNPFVPDLDKK